MSSPTRFDELTSEYTRARRRRGWKSSDDAEYGHRMGFARGYCAEPDVPADDVPPGLQAGYSEGRDAWRTNHP